MRLAIISISNAKIFSEEANSFLFLFRNLLFICHEKWPLVGILGKSHLHSLTIFVSIMIMMRMFDAQCTKHSCTCPIFFVHPPDQSTFTTGPPHPAWKTLCPYGVGKIYVLKGTNMFLDSFQRNTIQFRGNSYLFRNFSWQAPIFRSLSQRVVTLFPKIILLNWKLELYFLHFC